MRILLVNAHGADIAFGGAERYVADLRDGIEAEGDLCSVLSAFPVKADRSQDLQVLRSSDWRTDPVRRVRTHLDSWVASPTVGLESAIAASRPDVVHTNNLFGFTTAVWECARRLNLPVVHTLHDYGLLCPRTTLMQRDGTPCQPSPLFCGLRARRLGRWASRVSQLIGVSAHVLNRHDEFFGAGPARHVVRPPLVTTVSRDAQTPARDRLHTLGYLGALDVHKGVEEMLAAAPRLATLGVQLRVAGGGPMEEAVAAAPNVEYAGRLVGDQTTAFLASCDAGLVPSRWDEPGLTFAALEWLGAGRPVLATRRGGLAELGECGVVRLSGTADDLVDQVGVLADGDRWVELLSDVPAVAGDHEARRWLDAHRRIYELAQSGPHGVTLT